MVSGEEEEDMVSGRWSAARELAGVGRDRRSTEVPAKGFGRRWCCWEGKWLLLFLRERMGGERTT
jgi:hypothetical protein